MLHSFKYAVLHHSPTITPLTNLHSLSEVDFCGRKVAKVLDERAAEGVEAETGKSGELGCRLNEGAQELMHHPFQEV